MSHSVSTQHPMQCLLKCAKLSAAVALATFAVPNLTLAQHYTQTNLISDMPGMAAHTDPNLKNSWGLTRSPTVQPNGMVGSPWWIANNNSGTSTLDDGNGNPQNIAVEANGSTSNFVVVPPPGFAAPGTPSTPTGIVYNGSPIRRQPTSGPTSDGKDRRVDRREAATEGQSRQKCCGQSVGKEIPGLSNQPRGPNRSGNAESPKGQGQSTKTVAKLPKLNEAREEGNPHARMVGLLPPSRSYSSGLSTGTLDSETHAQMLLAALARHERGPAAWANFEASAASTKY